MQRVRFELSSPYEAVIGVGSIDSLGALLRPLAAGCVMVVTDENVAPRYLARAAASLQGAGFSVKTAVLPAGETTKSPEYYVNLLNQFAPLTRSDTVLALGGGVVSDLAGFAAATYLRGVRLVNVPTTLLAMVDAAAGGKTGIDLPAGKNLAGAFHQPALVVCDTALLATLPPRQLRSGWAEVIKTAVLFDAPLLEALENDNVTPKKAVTACLAHKSAVLCRDERDRGERQLLNLGHTLGHAVEACSGYTVLHGEAIAIGLAGMARAFCRDGARIVALLERFGLPTRTELPPHALANAALHDKKRRGDTVTLVMPERIGHCVLREVAAGKLEEIFQRCLL